MVGKYRKIIVAAGVILLLTSFQSERDSRTSLSPDNLQQAIAFTSIPKVKLDIAQIKERGKLIALLPHSSTGFFVYKGEPKGFEYDILKSFAKHLGVKLETIVLNDPGTAYELLNNGLVDIIAASLITNYRFENKVSVTKPFMRARHVLVQRIPKDWQQLSEEQVQEQLICSKNDLIGKQVHVVKGSNFHSTIGDMWQDVGGVVKTVQADRTEEELVAMVSSNLIDYTIVSEDVANINQYYYDNVHVNTPLSTYKPMAWGIRKNAPDLLAALDSWIVEHKKRRRFRYVYYKYFRDPETTMERFKSGYLSLNSNRISEYDKLIQSYSRVLNWDWRLLAAQVCQESRFNPNAQSFMGARGLMQIMPATAARFGINYNRFTPQQNVEAGIKFLITLEEYWKLFIENPSERIKFVLASYNAGLGHVIDARRLTEKYEFNVNKWDHVSFFLLRKAFPKYYNDEVCKHGFCRGDEPYNYVIKILNRYQQYQKVYKQGYDLMETEGKEFNSVKKLLRNVNKAMKEQAS